MSRQHDIESKLAEVKQNLNGIINELEEIADGLEVYKGIGAEKCSSALRRKANSLRKAIKQLNQVSSDDLLTQTVKNVKKVLPI